MSTFIEQEVQQQEAPVEKKRIQTKTTLKSVFFSQFAKHVYTALFVAVVIPTICYYYIISRNVTHEETEKYYCLIQEEFRVPCGYADINERDCLQIDCCYNTTTGQCHHFLPSKYFYKTQNGMSYSSSHETSPLGNKALPNLQFSIQEKNINQLSLVIHDPSEIVANSTLKTKNYSINLSTKKLIFEVLDKDNDPIFSTAKGALIASEYYWEWSFQLSDDTIFGLDRNVIRLSGNETLTKVIYKNKADHTTLPVFWAYQNGKFHSCVVKHDGPLEIQVLASNMIILRSLLGKKIEVELTLGPTPSQLYKQQIQEKIPPMWTMGTHNCRDGNTVILKDILKAYSKNKGSTFDTDCVHKNLFMALQQTNNSAEDVTSFQTTLEELVASGTKFFFSLSPHILIDEMNPLYLAAKELDLLYKYQSGIIYNSTYLGQPVVYPDFTDKNITTYIRVLAAWIRENIGMKNISGFILNDNWPQDDKYGNVEKIDFPYYSNEIDKQMKYTLPWTLEGSDGRLHLEKHNSYGSLQKEALYSYLNKTEDLSEVLFISSTKSFGDVDPEIADNFETSWDSFKMYLNKIMFSSITGNQMIGIPICGDSTDYDKSLQETLCLRWYIAAATMPFFQVFSANPFRDPANLGSKYATKVVELAIYRRKMLLDYFHTILLTGEPLVRPMYYNYHADTATFTLDRQYTLGSDIIIAQPFSNGKVKLQIYLPPEKGNWYEFWGGTMFVPQKKKGYIIEIDSLETDWTTFIAQGHIVALTDASKLDLYIALDCSSKNHSCTASGQLYKDSNYINFTATNNSVTIHNLPSECTYTVGYLKVYGYRDSDDYSIRYDKNKNICDSSNQTVTINYVEET